MISNNNSYKKFSFSNSEDDFKKMAFIQDYFSFYSHLYKGNSYKVPASDDDLRNICNKIDITIFDLIKSNIARLSYDNGLSITFCHGESLLLNECKGLSLLETFVNNRFVHTLFLFKESRSKFMRPGFQKRISAHNITEKEYRQLAYFLSKRKSPWTTKDIYQIPDQMYNQYLTKPFYVDPYESKF